MKKEIYNENQQTSYSSHTICFYLTQCARSYILKNNNSSKSLRDETLVEFINFIGNNLGYDFSLNSNDLHTKPKFNELIDLQIILTITLNYASKLIFTKLLTTETRTKQNLNFNKSLILVDFINHILKINNYSRIFTIEELYINFKRNEYKKEMKKLKDFLLLVSSYEEKIKNGESIDSIFKSMADKYCLDNISKKGVYYYNENGRKKYESMFMPKLHKDVVDRQIYAIAYAYVKSNSQEKPIKKIIERKIKEMQKQKRAF